MEVSALLFIGSKEFSAGGRNLRLSCAKQCHNDADTYSFPWRSWDSRWPSETNVTLQRIIHHCNAAVGKGGSDGIPTSYCNLREHESPGKTPHSCK